MEYRWGDSIVVGGCLGWLTFWVGPWWIGVSLLLAGWLLNLIQKRGMIGGNHG